MPYYSNIANQELQYFHQLLVKNFTIKLTDVLTSGLFKVETIIADSIYKIYPLFYSNTITSSNPDDRILDNRCIICNKKEKETYITFISDENEEIVDYSNYASYYDITDNLTTNQFNAYVSLLRHNTIHNDNIRIADNVNGNYGNYEFDLDGCTILDNGVVITDETVTAQPMVRLTDNVFHYSTYTLKLNILHYTGVNILDDLTPTDFIVVDILEIELIPNTWIPIPIANIENGYIIDFDTTIEIKHNKPVISDYIQTIEVTSEPSIIQTGETSEIYATGYDNGHVLVKEGHKIHFFEKLEPSLNVYATPSIIQTGGTTEIYSKVKDSDGSLAQNVKVHFYQQTEVPVPTTLSVVADNPVLSYSDGDSAVLSATVRDQDSLPMSNQSVVFKIGSTVLDTVLTDGTGVAEYEYTSQGAGDVVFTVECMNLQETFAIEDCTYYSTITHTNYNATLDIPLPTTFTLEYIINQKSSSWSVGYLDIGDSSNNRILVGQYAKAGTNGLIDYKGSQIHPYSTNPTLNTDNTIWFKYDGTKYYYKLNNGTVMEVADAGVTLTKLIHVEGAGGDSGNYVKNIKIKPL